MGKMSSVGYCINIMVIYPIITDNRVLHHTNTFNL